MAEINGRPFLEYLMDYLVSRGIQRVILSVGHRNEFIINHFGNRYKSLQLEYAIEKEPLGTGGGLHNAFQYALAETLFIFNGDTYFPIDLGAMESTFDLHDADLVIALRKVENAGRYGAIVTGDNNRILNFCEKGENRGTSLINGGIYLMKRQLLSGGEFPEKFSLEHDVFEKLVSRNRFYGIPFGEEFIDIGIPETYYSAGLTVFRN
jgi:D-glycero-alpha-D-manno-heptose 1-phosphate guanylyltransferase